MPPKLEVAPTLVFRLLVRSPLLAALFASQQISRCTIAQAEEKGLPDYSKMPMIADDERGSITRARLMGLQHHVSLSHYSDADDLEASLEESLKQLSPETILQVG